MLEHLKRRCGGLQVGCHTGGLSTKVENSSKIKKNTEYTNLRIIQKQQESKTLMIKDPKSDTTKLELTYLVNIEYYLFFLVRVIITPLHKPIPLSNEVVLNIDDIDCDAWQYMKYYVRY